MTSYSREFDQTFDALRPQMEPLGKIIAVILFGSLTHSAPKMVTQDSSVLESDLDLLVITDGGETNKSYYAEARFGTESWQEHPRTFSDRMPNALIIFLSIQRVLAELDCFLANDCLTYIDQKGEQYRVYEKGQQLLRMILVQAVNSGLVIEGALPQEVKEKAHQAYLALTDVPRREIVD
jgi:hypothetical protein